jgi:hypothetical protein
MNRSSYFIIDLQTLVPFMMTGGTALRNGSRAVCKLYNQVTSGGRLLDYEQAWRYQKVLCEHIGKQRKAGQPAEDSLIILQHPSVL